jgi:hypothetical protein
MQNAYLQCLATFEGPLAPWSIGQAIPAHPTTPTYPGRISFKPALACLKGALHKP